MYAQVREVEYTIDDVVTASKEGRVVEAFGAGTACIVSPVNSISYRGEKYEIPVPEDSQASQLMKQILDIQYGRIDHPWSVLC